MNESIWCFANSELGKPRTRDDTPEWREATRKMAIEQKMNPYTGMGQPDAKKE